MYVTIDQLDGVDVRRWGSVMTQMEEVITVTISTEGRNQNQFVPVKHGFGALGGYATFPTIGVAVAGELLEHYSAQYLGLAEPAAASWTELHTVHRVTVYGNDSYERWHRRPEEERHAIVEAFCAEELARTKRAHAILDAECERLIGKGFDAVLSSGRPFDPDGHRYRDPPFEYTDGHRWY
jgi:hypothetical protein